MSSNPTYPGGAPINLATECDSWNSLMSKRTSLTPIDSANTFAVSVLPQPVGPTNKKLPTGLLSDFNPACEI